MSPRLRNLLLASVALPTLGGAPAWAQPTGGTVVGGTATITGAGTPSVIVNQTSDRAIVNWTTFNLNTGNSATFNQPNSSSVILNRVTGGQGASFIDGTITANGRVFIVNRDGMLFGRNAVINTASFLATTHDIRDADFMAGRTNFNISGRPDASIVNLGTINATNRGFAALVAPGVRNSGTITARLGTVALASGNSFTLDMYGDRLIQLAVNDEVAARVIDVATGQPIKSLVSNDGKIRANGGRVELTAAAARHVVDSVINNKGVIEANSVGRRGGKIVLGGAAARGGLPKQTVRIGGTISAKGGAGRKTSSGPMVAGGRKGSKGGTIQITGEDIQFAAAILDVSGATGGGRILVGGDYGGGRPIPNGIDNANAVLEAHAIPTASTVTVDAATTFNASATESGHGGKVILWSDNVTSFAGTIYARGGALSGDGGFVEVSGKQRLAFTGLVNTLAAAGRSGTLLLDPDDYTIGAAEATTIQTNLLKGNVVIMTTASGTGGNGDIFVNSGITWATGNSLTLSAFRDINVNANISNTSGRADINLRADNTGIFQGSATEGKVNFASASVDITTGGQVSIFYNPVSYTVPISYADNMGAGTTHTAYMLVNTAANWQAINSNLNPGINAGYALGRDIDASTVTTALGTFRGILDGQNQTISGFNLTGNSPINRNEGTIRNLNVANVTITANANGQILGGLVGTNAFSTSSGKISNVTISGTVNAASFESITAGGLVGLNEYQITNSHAAVNVSIGNGTPTGFAGFNRDAHAGGLVGMNIGVAIDRGIFNSSASGNVSGGGGTLLGGLAGSNGDIGAGATITNSFATGNVNGQSPILYYALHAGGLVGDNWGSITNSYATGNVTVSGPVNIVNAGGLVGQLRAGATNGLIATSYASGTVTINNTYNDNTNGSAAGGIVGSTDPSTTVRDSYALGNVSVFSADATNPITAGGLVGLHNGAIERAYSTGQVSSSSPGAQYTLGGFIGTIDAFGSISGGYWDTSTGGQPGAVGLGSNAGVADLNAAQARTQSCFTGTSCGGSGGIGAFNFTTTWFMLDGQTRPFLRMEQSTTIRNAHQLQLMAMDLSYQYTLANTIDLGPSLSNAREMWGPNGFASIAQGSCPGAACFMGTFNGNGFTIANLTSAANSPGGLFGSIGQGAIVKNLTLSNVAITATANSQAIGAVAGISAGTVENIKVLGGTVNGLSFSDISAGGIVGFNDTTGIIQNSISQANVTIGDTTIGLPNRIGGAVGLNLGIVERVIAGGTVNGGAFSFAGGLVGWNDASAQSRMTDSYAIGTVSGRVAGGLVGNLAGGTIETSYSTGFVNASVNGGGLVGRTTGGTITDSFWDRETSGQSTSAGSPSSAGKTTKELQASLPSGWSTAVWGIITGGGTDTAYPYLSWQFGGATPQVVSGTVFTDRGVTREGGGTQVLGVVNGISLASVLTGGSVTTGANGYYYFLLAPGTIPTTDAQVLTYVNAKPGPFAPNTNYGVAFQHNAHLSNLANPYVAGLDIYRDWFHARTPAQTLSDAGAGQGAAVGFDQGAQTAVSAVFDRNQQLDFTNSNSTFRINVAISNLTAADSKLVLNGANIAIDSAITLSGSSSTVSISASGSVSQSAVITARNLALLGGNTSTFALDGANNQISTLAANLGGIGGTGTVRFRSDGSYAIGSVDGTAGIIANTVALTSSGIVTQNAGAPITATKLALINNGDFRLNNAGNQIGTLAVDKVSGTGSVELTVNGGLTIGTVVNSGSPGTISGVTTDRLVITATGSVTQSERIAVTDLSLNGSGGSYTLDHASNVIATLAGNVGGTGTISVTDSTGLVIGNTSAATLKVTSAGNVTQSAAIVATDLIANGGGNFTLTNAANNVVNFAAAAGNVTLTDSGTLNIGVTSSGGVTANALTLQSPNNSPITVTQSAPITANSLNLVGGAGSSFTLTRASNAIGTLAANAPTVSIASTGTVTQTAPIIVDSLTLAGGSFVLDNAGNAIGTLSANVTSLSVRDDGGLAIAGINAGDLTVSSTGPVTQSAAIAAANLNLLGNSGSIFTLTHAGNQIGTLAASAGIVDIASTGTVTQIAPIAVNFLTLAGGSFVLNNAGNAIGTVLANVNSLSVRDDGGLAIAGINAGNLTVSSTGTVTQTGAITVSGLTLAGGGNFVLDHANNAIGTLSANVNSLSITDHTGLVVAGVNASNLTVSSNGAVTQTGVIVAANLNLLGNGGGNFTLTHANNQIGTLAANANAVTIASTGTVTQTAPITVSNLTLAGGSFVLDHANNAIGTLSANVNSLSITDNTGLVIAGVNVSNLTVSSNGAVTQSGAIVAANLNLLGNGGGNFTLTDANNQIGTLAGNVAGGTIHVANTGSLSIGTVGGTTGLTADTVVLSTPGTVTQTAPVNASNLVLLGNGASFVLDNASNDVTRLATDTGAGTGSVLVRDNTGFTIVTLSGTFGNIVGARTGTLTLASTATIDQGAAIAATNLIALGGGNFSLTHTSNDVVNFAAAGGTVGLIDTGSLNIGISGAGVQASTFNLQHGGSVTQSAPIMAGAFNLRGGAGSTVTLSDSGNRIARLTIDNGSPASGSVSLTNGRDLVLGGSNGTFQAGTLVLKTAHAVTQDAAINVGGLTLAGGGGRYTLDHSGNAIATLTANVDTLRVTDNGGLVLAGVTANTLVVTSTGAVTQTAPIVVGNLGLLGIGGQFTLDHPQNVIGTFAADVGSTGVVSVTDNTGLVIGSVNPVGATAGTLVLSSTGVVTQSAPITVANLVLLGNGGTFTLTDGSNQIGTFAANTGANAGAVNLAAQGDIAIGSLPGAVGVTTGALAMQQTGTINANAAVNVGSFYLIEGDWVQVGNPLPAFNAGNVRLGADASFLRATGGDGTSSDPYSIHDVYGLQAINGLLDRHFKLATNIDASATRTWNDGQGFSPIGSVVSAFMGSLDGNGHTISNLTIAPANANRINIGLFAVIGESGAVRNLNLTNANIKANVGDGFGPPPVQFVGILAGTNLGTVSKVSTSGKLNAAAVAFAVAGGNIGFNLGTVSASNTTADVTIGTGMAGGFVGINAGTIALSFAKGVNDTTLASLTGGDGAIVGGFAGINLGTIDQAYARVAVAGGDGSVAGGFAGINFGFDLSNIAAAAGTTPANTDASLPGTIARSYALGPVTVGNAGIAAAFAALNFGAVDQVYGAGRVQGGAGSTLGGLVAANNLLTGFNVPPDFDPGFDPSTLPAGTATKSFWDMQTTGIVKSAGGTGMNTSTLAGGLPPGFDPTIWSHGSYPHLVNLGPQNTTPGTPVIPPVEPPPPEPPPPEPTVTSPPPNLPPPAQQIQPGIVQGGDLKLANQTLDLPKMVQQLQAQPKSDGQPKQSQPQQQQSPGQPSAPQPVQQIAGPAGPVQVPGPAPIRLDVGENRHFYLPPPGETRVIANEVVLQLPCGVSQADLDAILKQHNLTVLGSQCLQTGGNAAYRMRHASSQQVASVIRALAAHQIIAAAQANYTYQLTEGTTVQGATSEQGDPGQYVPEKLQLAQIHKTVRGTNVLIAVIDSEIDGKHPDLDGTIIDRFDATGVEESPHAHGTGMAGAIVSRQRLLGVAPGARLYAIRAFSVRAASAESTTYNILKGIDWAINNNVRIINMSFAGPRDPSLERALKAAYDKGLILIAAAGNAGPRALPLFPAADPHVIAVTATDIEDKLFTGANRGTHLTIAAPGVDILVPAPAGEYQVTTGTSVATAHISGVVALMLERNPKLTPADVRKILAGSARRLGPTNQFGAGLVDPVRALELATPRSATAPTGR